MTRKDYKLIAAALWAACPNAEWDANDHMTPETRAKFAAWRNCVDKMVLELGRANPKFDKVIFYKACGVA